MPTYVFYYVHILCTALTIGQKFSRCQAEAGKTYASSCCVPRISLSTNAFTKDCKSLNASSYSQWVEAAKAKINVFERFLNGAAPKGEEKISKTICSQQCALCTHIHICYY